MVCVKIVAVLNVADFPCLAGRRALRKSVAKNTQTLV